MSHNRSRAALCVHIQAVSNQPGEKLRRLYPKELRIVKAELKATTFAKDKKL